MRPRPELASLIDGAPISLRALHQTFTVFVGHALRASSLPDAEREQALRASAHWLRHTFATRSIEYGMPLDVAQDILGHENPSTTAAYARAQQRRRPSRR